MKKFKIKKNDKVVVISGKDKGKSGIVISVLRQKDRVFVSGVNLIKKHTKPTQAQSGGVVSKEAAIHISNVAIVCPKTNLPTRIGFTVQADGKKVRVAKKSGEVISN